MKSPFTLAGPYQPTMVPGRVEYKRKYTLWVLILLILICWPAAIIYYFTREKVPVQEFQTYAAPMTYSQPPPAAGGRFCQACGASNAPGATFCSRCGKSLG
jgi:hypothetical protein